MSSSTSRYSDSDIETGRDRSATFPPRAAASQRAPEKIHKPHSKGLGVRCHTSPIGLDCEESQPSSSQLRTISTKSNKIVGGNRVSSRKQQAAAVAVAGGTARRTSKKGSDTPSALNKSGSVTSLSGGSGGGSLGGDDGGTSNPRWIRSRRHNYYRKGLKLNNNGVTTAGLPAAPIKRQQHRRIVSAVIGLVVMLASGQILVSLVVHPSPREGRMNATALSSPQATSDNNNGATVEGAGVIRRRAANGVRGSSFLRGGEIESNGSNISGIAEKATTVTAAANGGRFGGSAVSNDVRGGAGRHHHQGLSLSSPRAFEMVAADMGHLKDTIEKLEGAFKKSMGKQGNDIALVMHHLGLQPSDKRETPAQGAADVPSLSIPKPFSGNPDDYRQKKSVPTEASHGQPHPLPNSQNRGAEAAIQPGVDKFAGGVPGGVSKALSGDGPDPDGGSRAVGPSREGRPENNTGTTGSNVDVWNAYAKGQWENGQWVPKVLVDESTPNISLLNENQRRVLLVSERRSGAGAVGGVLDSDSRVFYVGDPCRMGGGPEALIGDACSALVSRLLACQPTINDIRNLYSFSYIVKKSRALSQFEKLRKDGGGNPEENEELVRASLEKSCGRSEVVMVKETRFGEVAPIVSTSTLGTDFLQIVRDPRAIVHGLSQSWKESKNKDDRAMAKDCTDLAARVCSSTETKLNVLTGLGKERFRVLKYEMVIEAPFSMMKSIYSWLDLGDIPQEVMGKIMAMSTHHAAPVPPGVTAWDGPRTNRDWFDWATRWAAEMPAFRRHQIQHVCQPLLVTLGYEEFLPTSPWPDEAETDNDSTSAASTVNNVDGDAVSRDSASTVVTTTFDEPTEPTINTSETI